jgi:hypothetical protein
MDFPLGYRVQIDLVAHPASYPMGNRGSLLEIKLPKRDSD